MKAAEAVSLLGVGQVALAGLCIGLSVWTSVQTFKLFDAFIDGNENAGEAIVKQSLFDVIFTVGLSVFNAVAKPVLRLTLKNNKLIKKLGLSDELISRFAKSFGNDELDWLRKARGLNISSDVITSLSKMDGFGDKMDEILELIKKSSRSADEVAECIIKHGDEASDAIR